MKILKLELIERLSKGYALLNKYILVQSGITTDLEFYGTKCFQSKHFLIATLVYFPTGKQVLVMKCLNMFLIMNNNWFPMLIAPMQNAVRALTLYELYTKRNSGHPKLKNNFNKKNLKLGRPWPQQCFKTIIAVRSQTRSVI